MSGDRHTIMDSVGDAGGLPDNWLASALQDDEPAAPSAQLWPRIERSHRRRRLRRQLLQGVSAVLLLGVLGGLAWQPWQQPLPARIAADAIDGAMIDLTQTSPSARLRQIDRQLEAAYARGDSSAIQTLWQRREHMLHTLEQDTNDESTSILAL